MVDDEQERWEGFDSCLSEVQAKVLLMCVMPMGKMWIKERERHSDSKAKMSARGKNVIKGANSISPECPELWVISEER